MATREWETAPRAGELARVDEMTKLPRGSGSRECPRSRSDLGSLRVYKHHMLTTYCTYSLLYNAQDGAPHARMLALTPPIG